LEGGGDMILMTLIALYMMGLVFKVSKGFLSWMISMFLFFAMLKMVGMLALILLPMGLILAVMNR
jgi:hypothetical protein